MPDQLHLVLGGINYYTGRLSVVTARGGLQDGSIGASYLQPAATVTQIQPARTVTYFQPTINTARLQPAAAVTAQARLAPTAQRAAAKPQDNSTMRAPLGVAPGMVDAGWLAARTAEANKKIPYGSSGSAIHFNVYHAGSSAVDYYYGGALVGGVLGCVGRGIVGGVAGFGVAGVGAIGGAALGCGSGGTTGASIGQLVGPPIGFILGGIGVPDPFECWADQVATPWQ